MNPLEKFTLIGLGSWNMERNPRDSIHALQAGIQEGSNHIDTAEMYGDGRVEKIVGEAIHGQRHKIHLVSKVLASNADYQNTLKACERSLKRLGTDYLDVYLLHWREQNTPLEETFSAFEKLKTDGKIRAWGVSNFDVHDLEETVGLVGPPSPEEGKMVCNQVYYSIEQRSVESKLLPWCNKHKVRVVAYSPLGQGRLPDHKSLSLVAKQLNVTPAQVVLAFLTRNKDVIAIPKSSDVQRTLENIHAMKIQLTQKQIDLLDEAFPIKLSRSLPMI